MKETENTADVALDIYEMAFDLFDRGIVDQAELMFQSLTYLEPEWQDAWVGYGICLRVQGKLDAAQVAFDTARTLAPTDSTVMFHRCELACAQRDWAGAYAEAQDFLALQDKGKPVAGHLEMAQLVDFLQSRMSNVSA